MCAQYLQKPPPSPICLLLARRTLGADGKDYRANFVHVPFPEKSYAKRPLKRSMVRRLPTCETSLAM